MVSTGKLRPSCPSETSSRALAILVEKCSEFDIELRPSFEWICDYLKKNRTTTVESTSTTTSTSNWISSMPTAEDYQNRVKVEQKQEQQPNEYSNIQQQKMMTNKPTSEDYQNRVRATADTSEQSQQQAQKEYSNIRRSQNASDYVGLNEAISEYVIAPRGGDDEKPNI
jgi:hypothetical protein